MQSSRDRWEKEKGCSIDTVKHVQGSMGYACPRS